MKIIVCHCEQCRGAKQRLPKHDRKTAYQVRAKRHYVKQLLKNGRLNPEEIQDILPTTISLKPLA